MSENKSLNQKFEELEKAKEWFYSDEFELDKAVEKYKSAIALAKELQKDLDDLKNEIEILDEDFTK
ncbi:exodeoxyribonuclease VII small subunit [Candidatus Saccharibacteria bacterium]|nr:exodeoxyribonuclease VII small subunit [Candidatus Saccharibacteria bacterium]